MREHTELDEVDGQELSKGSAHKIIIGLYAAFLVASLILDARRARMRDNLEALILNALDSIAGIQKMVGDLHGLSIKSTNTESDGESAEA